MAGTGRSAISRRRLLAALVLAPPALAACSLGGPSAPKAPDPLIALADAARSDAALAAAAIAARPELADRVQPMRDARTQHAAALDAEVARLEPARPTTAPTPMPAPPAPTDPVTLAALRTAVQASADAAAAAALELPAERVGLVAAVAACCQTYAAVWE